MRKYFKEIIIVLGDTKKKVPFLILLFVFGALIELVGLGLIVPYVSMMISPEGVLGERVMVAISSLGLSTDSSDMFIFMGMLLIFVFAVKAVAAYFINLKVVSFSTSLIADLQSKLMRTYLFMSYEHYLMNNNAYYMSVTQSLTGQYGSVVASLLRMVGDIILSASIMFLLLANSPFAFLLMFFLISTAVLIYEKVYSKKLRELGEQGGKYAGLLIRGINEGLSGIKEIRILGKEKSFHRLVHEGAYGGRCVQIEQQAIKSIPRLMLEFVMITFIVGLAVGSLLMGLDMSKLAPTYALFAIAGVRLIPIATSFTASTNQIRYGRYATSVISRDINELGNYQNFAESGHRDYEARDDGFEILSVKNVSYRYPNASFDVIKNISMDIKRGSSIGIIGRSGAGKSTFVNLLTGLLEPRSGEIHYNGELVKNNINIWTDQIAYLPQKVFISDDTIKHNIALGEADSEIDDDRVMKAIKQADLFKLVNSLPGGLDTFVGEDGVRLSGGQRQRVAIARAFYFERIVLIYDEATSSLDNETEKEIIKEIEMLKGHKTTIIISHQLSILSKCDVIYRFSDGEIVQKGSFEKVVGKENSVN